MKTKDQVEAARARVRERVQTPGISQLQLATLMGMLNALVWVCDGKADGTMLRVLSDEPMPTVHAPRPSMYSHPEGD